MVTSCRLHLASVACCRRRLRGRRRRSPPSRLPRHSILGLADQVTASCAAFALGQRLRRSCSCCVSHLGWTEAVVAGAAFARGRRLHRRRFPLSRLQWFKEESHATRPAVTCHSTLLREQHLYVCGVRGGGEGGIGCNAAALRLNDLSARPTKRESRSNGTNSREEAPGCGGAGRV